MTESEAPRGPEMRQGFLAEARRYLKQIGHSSNHLASGQMAAAENLAYAAHSLRGSSGTLGLHSLADASAGLEAIGDALFSSRLRWDNDIGEAIGRFYEAATGYLEEFGFHEAPPSSETLDQVADTFEELASYLDESDEISEVLAEEARESLGQMASTLRDIARDPKRRSLLEEVRRPAHTLKGAASTAGFVEVGLLSHRLEDLLEVEIGHAGPVDEESIQLVLDVMDGLEDLLAQGRGAVRSAEIDQLYERLQVASGASDSGASDSDSVETGASESGASASVEKDVVSGDQEAFAGSAMVSTVAGTDHDQLTVESAEGPISQDESESAPDAGLASIVQTTTVREVAVEQAAVEQPVSQELVVSQQDEPRKTVSSERFLRIPVEGLDEVMRVAGESLVHRSSLTIQYSALREVQEELSGALNRIDRLSKRLSNEYEARALEEMPRAPAATSSEFDSLEMDRYTEIHLISRELAEAASDFSAVATSLGQSVTNLDGFQGRLGRLLSELQERLGQLRLVPFSQLQGRLFRAVRVAEKEAGKRVDFHLDAAGVDLDKNVLEELSEPLLHVLRNAVGHGIESASERLAAGKKERGEIRVSATHHGTQIEVSVADDGRGLDLEGLKAKALAKGLLSKERIDSLTEDEVAQLAFLPSVSTARQVSQLSGRGIGLDVMKTVAGRLRGSVSIHSEAGKGMRLVVRLPMTLASLNVVFAVVEGQTYGVPRAAVQQIIRLSAEDAATLGNEQVIRIGSETIPLLELGSSLGVESSQPPTWPRPALVMHTGDGTRAVLVDSLKGSADVVVKSLGHLLVDLPGYIGATLTGDGAVVLLIDPNDLSPAHQTPKPRVLEEIELVETPLRVLVVDDSLTVRRILTRLIEARGWIPFAARDGQEALEAIQGGLAPDVMLLDIEMPRMDGYELTALLRSNPQHREIPIVMLTSRAGQKHRAKATELGIEEYLVKPYQEELLVAAVLRVTEEQQEAKAS